MEICDFLKSWKRMCNSMTEMNGCEDCPIVRNAHGARCGDMPCEMQDVESIAREMNDLIPRAAAIEAFDDERVDRNYGDVSPESVIKVIESIPAVNAIPVGWLIDRANDPRKSSVV